MRWTRFVRGAAVFAAVLSSVVSVGAAEATAARSPGEIAPKTGRVSFDRSERRLEIAIPADATAATELRIETPGLSDVETGEDVGEPGIIYLPPPAPNEPAPPPAENVFFFNELSDAPGWELVIAFDAAARGTWKLNGRFSPLGGAQRAEVVIPVDELESGENLLHLTGESLRVPRMYFRRRFPAGATADSVVRVVPIDWAARVQWWRVAAKDEPVLVEERAVAGAPAVRKKIDWPDQWWTERAKVVEAALAVGENLCRNQVRRRGSVFEGGFNLVYDVPRKAHRMDHWIWAWGPAIDLLLELSKFDEAHARGQAERFRDVALAAGERSLHFGVTEPGHQALGVSRVRWEPSRATPLGWAEYASPTDSLFMAGWGWMSMYAETKDARYLERMRQLTAAAGRLREEYGVIPQDWIFERNRWTPHTLDESLFGTIGFRRLYEATHEPAVVEAGRRFVDSYLKVMARSEGTLARGWMHEEKKDIWDADVKGHAWVMEGYLDAYQLTHDERYLGLAKQLAAKTIACQGNDGAWTYLFHRPGADDPIDDKGTAIWAYLLYDLHRRTQSPEHLAAARRALGWCLRHQWRGDDPNLDGGILHPNNMAYVRRRPMTVLYTTTFFGLALLEELRLEQPGAGGR